MKRLLYTIIIFLLFSAATLAQNDKQQIESIKAAYITERLNLSPDEAQRFWPLYNNYQQELQHFVKKKHGERQAMRQRGASVDELKIDTEMLELKKRYRQEFSKVLAKEKVALFYQAEREFRQELIQHLHRRKQSN